ncbi:MAG: sodium:alanine symporter family protein [Clostridia bacterium]|nr:sodium:alanine symporter family protein [Clostridia bacterium]
MEEWLLKVVSTINAFLADYILIVLLVGVGIWYTVKTKFVQVRCFGQGMKNVFGSVSLNGKKEKSGMSSFQAFATAVAGQVGTGNIIGASGAILLGGPGAIFWMWIIAFLGMATIYAEAVLAQKTRVVGKDGTVAGGPVQYIKTAFPNKFGKFLAVFFAVASVIALGFIGAMVQSNSIGEAIHNATGGFVPTWVVGLVLVLVCAFIFIGGVSRIASVSEKIVPVMAVLYILGGIIILFARITFIPEAFGMIFKYAFNPKAIIGGSVGMAIKTAISQGAKRGLFSNEAGMGSTPHAHAQANVKTPHQQGTVAIASVFIDTFVVLTFTALIVISTLYTSDNAGAWMTLDKSQMVANGFAVAFGGGSVALKIGSIFVAICLTFFAFSTIVSWNLFGKINFEYLFGKKGLVVYSLLALVFILLGSIFQNDLVWELTDFFNYLMVLPNVIALFALTKLVQSEIKKNSFKKKGEPLYEPKEETKSVAEGAAEEAAVAEAEKE